MSTQAIDPTTLDRYECEACGYVYEPTKGDDKRQVSAGTAFEALPADWRCPVCGARTSRFTNIGSKASPGGIKGNASYGFANALNQGQKNLLIFGGLILAFLFFMSLYGLQ